MNIPGWLYWVVGGLLIINYLTGGAVVNRLGGVEGATSLGLCYYAINFWNPFIMIGPFALPIPSLDDAAAAIALAAFLIWLFEKAKKRKSTFKEKLVWLLTAWLMLRLLAAYLLLAIPGCAAIAQTSNMVLEPIQGVLIIGGILLVIKWMMRST